MPNKKKNAKEELAADTLTELTDDEANNAAGGVATFNENAANKVKPVHGAKAIRSTDPVAEYSTDGLRDTNTNQASGILNLNKTN